LFVLGIDHKEKKVLGGAAVDVTKKKNGLKHNFDGSCTEAITPREVCAYW